MNTCVRAAAADAKTRAISGSLQATEGRARSQALTGAARAGRPRAEIPSAGAATAGCSPARELRCARMTRPAPTPEAVMLSAHAVEQYQQRVKPGLGPTAARFELEQLRPVGRISRQAPGWVNAARPALYYLLLGDAVVLALAPQGEDRWVATTCVTQGGLTPTHRAAKSARKASLSSANRARRRARF
jgi:hypothetical protein